MTFLRAVLTVIFAGLFVVAASAQRAPGRRVALVIGNSAYAAQGTLANPGPDSRLVADALRRVGFTVTARNDLGKQAMELALRDFSRAADGAEVALIYYAGHGMEANGVNWLLPVDAVLAEERNLRFEAIDLDTTLAAVEGAKGLRMVVLDACRNNPFARSMRRSVGTRSAVTRGLADVEVTGTLVLYAARGGTVAQDGAPGGNSPFAIAFARRIPEPGVDIRLLASKVRDDVLAATGMSQEPFTYGSLPGLILSLSPAAASHAPSATLLPETMPRRSPFDISLVHADVLPSVRSSRQAEQRAREAQERAKEASRVAETMAAEARRRWGGRAGDFGPGMAYFGETSDGKARGYGVVQFMSGEAAGSKYAGVVNNNRIIGPGVWTYGGSPRGADPAVYEGEFDGVKATGYGVMTGAAGHSFAGQFRDDRPNGFGVFIMGDGRRMEGNWRNSGAFGWMVEWDSSGRMLRQGRFNKEQFVDPR